MFLRHPQAAWRVIFAFNLVVAILFLSACEKAFPAPEPEAIAFLYPTLGSNPDIFYPQIVEIFKKQAPNITVSLNTTDMESNWVAQIKQVDCFAIPADYLMMLAPPGQGSDEATVVALDEMIAQDESLRLADFYPGPLQLVSKGGKTYGIPSGVNPMVMYYNKDLFDNAGVPYPRNGWTWDDFLNTALALRNEEENIWGYVPLVGDMDAILFIYQGGGSIVDDLQNPTRLTLNDPQTVKALEWYSSLFQTYKVAPSSAGDIGTGNNYRDALEHAQLAGKVGMWIGSYQEQGGRLSWSGNLWPFKSGMVSLPRGEKAATYMSVETYAISSKSEHKHACWQWISFLSGQISREAHLLPARRSLIESVEFANLVGEDVAGAARASLEAALPPPNFRNLSQFSTALSRFSDAVDGLVQGQWTVQEAMDSIQKEAK